MMEKWIDRQLEEKMKCRKCMFLGTEFEKTRIKDPRINELDPPKEVKKK